MGESKKKVKKFEMDWWKNLTELDKGYGFRQSSLLHESPKTLQDASV